MLLSTKWTNLHSHLDNALAEELTCYSFRCEITWKWRFFMATDNPPAFLKYIWSQKSRLSWSDWHNSCTWLILLKQKWINFWNNLHNVLISISRFCVTLGVLEVAVILSSCVVGFHCNFFDYLLRYGFLLTARSDFLRNSFLKHPNGF